MEQQSIINSEEPPHKEKATVDTQKPKINRRDVLKKKYTCRHCSVDLPGLGAFKKHRAEFPSHFKIKARAELFCRLCSLDFKAELYNSIIYPSPFSSVLDSASYLNLGILIKSDPDPGFF